jgi:hypothetical protein
LLRAAAVGRIALTAVLDRKAHWSPHDMKSKLPTIVLIGDDRGLSRSPPDRPGESGNKSHRDKARQEFVIPPGDFSTNA